MPRIQEYLPEENAAAPQGALTPNLEQVTAAGRGMETFGRDVGEGLQVLHQRQTQMEQDDAYTQATQTRVQGLQDIQDGEASGQFDLDTYKQNLNDWKNQLVDNQTTAGGKIYAQRQADRTIGALLVRGMKASVKISNDNKIATYNQGKDDLTTSVSMDPSEDNFYDSLAQGWENSEHLPPEIREKADLDIQHTLAKERLTAIARVDPQQAEDLLKDKDFASMINAKDRDGLLNMVDRAKAAKEEGSSRIEAQKEREQKAIVNKYLSDDKNFKSMMAGTLTPEKFLADTHKLGVDIKTQDAFVHLINTAQESVVKTNPIALNNVRERILDQNRPDSIFDVLQLAQAAQKAGLHLKDVDDLKKEFLDTPMGTEQKEARKRMEKDIEARLKLPVSGITDQDGPGLVNVAVKQFEKARDAMVKEGKNPASLLDPTSKDYFPNTIPKRSFADSMKNLAQASVQGNKAAEPNPIYTLSPGAAPNSVKKTADGITEVTLKGGKVARYDKDGKLIKETK